MELQEIDEKTLSFTSACGLYPPGGEQPFRNATTMTAL